MTHNQGNTVVNSMITAFIALIPAGVLGYAEKLMSVLVLAMVAELGRRTISLFWRNKP